MIRLADRLEVAVRRCKTLDAVASAMFTSIQPDIPFSFGCLATTDPLTG